MDDSTTHSKPIKLDYVDNKLVLAFDDNEHTRHKLSALQGVRHNRSLKRWEAPISCYNQIVTALDNLVISTKVIQVFAKEAELELTVKKLRSDEYFELEDYSPKVPLMSHQKKQFELHRILKGSASFSEMGAGKCTIPETLVNIDGQLQKIETVWKNYSNKQETEDPTGGYWSNPIKDLAVCALSDGKIQKRKVKKLFRQKISEKIRLVKTDDGNQVGITKAHKLYSVDHWSNGLNVGQQICVPRIIPHEDGALDLELSELMGWMVGDGCDSDARGNKHEFTQKEERSRNHVRQLLGSVATKNGIDLNVCEYEPRETHRAHSLYFQNSNFADLLKSHGYLWGEKSRTKEVPSSVMQADKEGVAAYLRGFFDAEAWVDTKKYQIEISSASEFMMKQVNTLLRRFGIWMRVRKKRACATNGTGIYRDYWVGILGGGSSRIYAREIGFFTDYKHNDLQKFLDVKSNSNVEGLPAYRILREIVDTTKLPVRHITDSYTVYLKGTQEPSRETLQVFINNIDKIIDGRKRAELSNLPPVQTYSVLVNTYEETKSFGGVAKKLNAAGLLTKRGNHWHGSTVKIIITKGEAFPYKDVYDNLDVEWLKEKRNQLQQLIDQEVHYVKITSIEEIDYDGWVYDLEVEDDHNYVAENILCHNTGPAICAVHWHLEMGNINKALVVCPKSVLRGWEEQIEFFSDLSYVSVVGTKRDKKLSLDRNIYLINYEYTWRILDTLLDRSFDMVICDEAHRIKNPLAKQSKACYALGDAAKYRIALTGTPVLNTSLDAFGVMRFVDPSIFGESFYSFRNKHFINVGNDHSPIKIYVPRKNSEEAISNGLYTKALRVLKSQCLDLPEATHAPNRIATLSAEQDKAYKNLQEELSAQITEDESITITHVLTLMLKLSQITSGWIKNTETQEIIRFKSNPKLEELKTLVEESGDQPLIVWAYYIEDMRQITNYFGRCKKCKEPVNKVPGENCPKCNTYIRYRCSEVQGSTKHRNAEIAIFRLTKEERAELRAKFVEEGRSKAEIRHELGDLLDNGEEPPQTNVIACQCVAASEGLNLQRATLAIFYSRNWSLKDWVQALARNHRKGQGKKVTYVSLVARLRNGDDTVDQRISDALSKKVNLSKRVNKDELAQLLVKDLKANSKAVAKLIEGAKYSE